VGVYRKLRWQKFLNEFKFVSEELVLVRRIGRSAAPDFQKHYEKYLASQAVDLHQLNRENKDAINEAYGAPPAPSSKAILSSPPASTALIKYQGIYTDEVLEEDKSEYVLTKDDLELHEAFVKVFKKIAMKIHPDKLSPHEYDFAERHALIKDFKDANEALSNKKYFTLIEIAQKLDIALPRNYNQQNRWMKREIKKIQHQINREKMTYNYIFAEAETPEEKDKVIQGFIQQIFGKRI
jgi:hypothetical protein